MRDGFICPQNKYSPSKSVIGGKIRMTHPGQEL